MTVADFLFPRGSRIQARFPTHGPEGWHQGTVTGTYTGQHIDMIRINFDEESLSNRGAVAACYVELLADLEAMNSSSTP